MPAAHSSVIYVKADASGAGDGSSWSNAFLSLQPAIDIASVSDQVWIAQGTYRPTSWPNGGTSDREKHFSLKNGVSVYGGFAGVETSLVERDPIAYPTILSGDLDANDADLDGDGRSDPATTSNNAYHVFYHPSDLGPTNTALLDGVTIRGGNANVSYSHDSGAGIYNIYCSPSVANSTLASNSASSSGGGIYNLHSSPDIANCTLACNSATNGGGIYNYDSSPSIANCTLTSNSASGGGGIYNLYSSPAIANSILWANTPYPQITDGASTTTVSYCIVQNGYAGGTNIIDADPLLLSLGDHGGPTPTMPVSLGSPAIGGGLASAAPATDQRGFARDSLPDIGACEFQTLALVSDVSNPAPIGSQFTLRAISDIAGATFQWFGRQSGNTWEPIEGGTNGLFATSPLDLGLDLWVRVTGQGTNVDSAVQPIKVRGTYPEWVAFHGLAGADAETGASPAADGIPNLVKYASGLDPHTSAVPSDHSTLFSVPASNTVSLIWIQSKTPTDLTWGFRKSHDLQTWSPADAVPSLCESNSACNVWSITMPVATNNLFLDVEVTRSAP